MAMRLGNITTPSAVALLEMSSTTKGLLPPRMTTAQKLAIVAITGLTVFDLTIGEPQYFNGTAWVSMTGGSLFTVSGNNIIPVGFATQFLTHPGPTGVLASNVTEYGRDIAIGAGTINTTLIGAAISAGISGNRNAFLGDGFSIGATVTNTACVGSGGIHGATSSENSVIGTLLNVGVGANDNVGAGYVGLFGAGALRNIMLGRGFNATGSRNVGLGDGVNTVGTDRNVTIGSDAFSTVSANVTLGADGSATHDNFVGLGRGVFSSAANQCAVGGTGCSITAVLIGKGPTSATPVAVSIEPTQNVSGAGVNMTLKGGKGITTGGSFLVNVYAGGGTEVNIVRTTEAYYHERRAGSGTLFGGVACRLFQNFVDASTSGTTESDLHSFSLKANSLLHNGDSVVMRTTLNLDTLVGTLTLKARLGTTDATFFNAAVVAGATRANYEVTITRVSNTVQRVMGTMILQATATVPVAIYTTMAETLSGDLTLAVRAGIGTSGTITANMTTVDYLPAPQ